jgi:hypothetical protein
MQKFLVLYMAPVEGLEAWMKQDEAVRKEDEAKMKAEWDAWVDAHTSLLTGPTAGVGKNKRVTRGSVEDVKNEIMLTSIIEADSPEAAAAAFTDHPHFGIPDAWIDVMPLRFLPGMEG